MIRSILALVLFAIAASGADVAGTWKGVVENSGGNDERTFVFKVDGNKLTGETTSQAVGKSEITDGTVDGDNLSFSIVVKIPGTELKVNYKGKVTGDTINFAVDIPSIQQKSELKVTRVR